ncbi:hypothetical protein [Gloeobacter kilaueensis]|uniref:Uncharacterized protein n=1 Tax=Gloeobacter kilaueensis (strain ATCC BAA-2537 / CCAP 1431/1 / ULC 316 / JS1) TaxID=1183438 RepID=U5QGK8_GLOK1|nr:hypothetical protein [Gloeobacter kilaueensis]AGY58102.1 hypothetical protein GKIL_1856 [Gloeobacter kilaueensis JS1]
MRSRNDDDGLPRGNPAWFDNLLEYEDRPLSKKLALGVAIGLVVTFLFFGATLLLYKPIGSKTAPPVATPAMPESH